MAQNGGAKRPAPPSPEDYQRLAREAESLRQSQQSGQSDETKRRSETRGGVSSYARYTGIGIQFVLLILLPTGLGYLADGWLGTMPWLTVAGAAIGSVGGMVWVVKSVFRMESRDEKEAK